MLTPEHVDPASVIEPNFFSNWGDLWYPRLANRLLTPASKMSTLTPNRVTIASFVLYIVAAGLIIVGGAWSVLGAVLLPVSYVLDCLDGQLARFTGQISAIGDYLDKTLDVVKIFAINAAMAVAASRLTGKNLYLMLGLMSCFGFLFRYYIKLETMFGAINRDGNYLRASSERRRSLYVELGARRSAAKNLRQRLSWLWFRNRSLFALDEAEHVTFGALAAAVRRPDLWLWIFGIGQLLIAGYRLVERGRQLVRDPESLTYPLRK